MAGELPGPHCGIVPWRAATCSTLMLPPVHRKGNNRSQERQAGMKAVPPHINQDRQHRNSSIYPCPFPCSHNKKQHPFSVCQRKCRWRPGLTALFSLIFHLFFLSGENLNAHLNATGYIVFFSILHNQHLLLWAAVRIVWSESWTVMSCNTK